MTKRCSDQNSWIILACSRLRNIGEKGEEKTRAKKRAGAGERQGSFLPFPATAPFFPQAPARVLFSRSPCVRADPTI